MCILSIIYYVNVKLSWQLNCYEFQFLQKLIVECKHLRCEALFFGLIIAKGMLSLTILNEALIDLRFKTC